MLRLGSVTFFALGVVLVLLGVHQSELSRDLGLDLAAFGLLGALLALGMGIGVTLSGPIVDRLPRRPLFAGACVLAGIALITVDREMTHARAAAHLVLLGLGCGGYVTLLNASIVERYRERAAPSLALMHAAATAGAGSGPWLIAAVGGRAGDWHRTFMLLGAWHLALALVGAFVRWPPPPAASASAPESPSPTAQAAGGTGLRLFSSSLFALATVGFAYVGVENGLTLFAVPWAESQGQLAAVGRHGISAFWLGLLSGRLVLAAQRRAAAPLLLVVCGAAGAIVVCLAVAGSWPLIAALGATGLALGPVYPVMMALTGRHFPNASGTALGLVGGAGAFGGFLLPWLAGMLGDARDVRSAIFALGCCAFGIALAALLLHRKRAGALTH